MKKGKITALVLGGVLFLAVVACAVFVGLRVAPAINHTMRISQLLQPVIEAENQTMRIGIRRPLRWRAMYICSPRGISGF